MKQNAIEIKRALISVTNKEGIVELATVKILMLKSYQQAEQLRNYKMQVLILLQFKK